MPAGKFERDIMQLVDRLCKGEEEYISKEIRRLGESLILLHRKNKVKILITQFWRSSAPNI